MKDEADTPYPASVLCLLHPSSFILHPSEVEVARMNWPTSADYMEAVQSPASFADPDLRQSTPVTTDIGLPTVCAGNFADVYRLAGQRTWAVKCFTRNVPDLQDRYAALSAHLKG